MKKDKNCETFCSSSRLPWAEATAPTRAAAHSLETTAPNPIKKICITTPLAILNQLNIVLHETLNRGNLFLHFAKAEARTLMF